MSYTLPTIDQCTFLLACLPEYEPVRGQFASGEPELDREDEARILERLDQGEQWAWCCVRVRAQYRGFEGDDYLGCCSYDSEADFVAEGGYYQQMKDEAFDRLTTAMRETAERLGCV